MLSRKNIWDLVLLRQTFGKRGTLWINNTFKIKLFKTNAQLMDLKCRTCMHRAVIHLFAYSLHLKFNNCQLYNFFSLQLLLSWRYLNNFIFNVSLQTFFIIRSWPTNRKFFLFKNFLSKSISRSMEKNRKYTLSYVFCVVYIQHTRM